MKVIEYAIKIKDEFVVFSWDYKMEWEDIYLSDLDEYNFKDILFENYQSAKMRMDKLIKDLNEFGKIDELSANEIDSMRIVKVEKVFSCTVSEIFNEDK